MSFVPKTQAFNAKINAVTLGTGDKAVVLGGQNVLPFYTFDAPVENAPKIGVEISDLAKEWTAPQLEEFYAGCETMADYAKKAETMAGADFLVLHFESADPNGRNRSVEECVADAKAVADVVDHAHRCHGLQERGKGRPSCSPRSAEALQGKNIVVLSAREEDYKSVGASVGSGLWPEGRRRIRRRHQPGQAAQRPASRGLGVAPESSIVMNVGTAAAGYGYEYVASTLDRVKRCGPGPERRRTCRCPLSPLSPRKPGASRKPSCPRQKCRSGATRKSAASKWKSPPPPPA